jgi:hypothetical protein
MKPAAAAAIFVITMSEGSFNRRRRLEVGTSRLPIFGGGSVLPPIPALCVACQETLVELKKARIYRVLTVFLHYLKIQDYHSIDS